LVYLVNIRQYEPNKSCKVTRNWKFSWYTSTVYWKDSINWTFYHFTHYFRFQSHILLYWWCYL